MSQDTQAISAGSGSFINAGTLNATNSTLGIISGNATTSIGQLPTPAANEPDLKTALTDLQIAIESSSLSDDDKADGFDEGNFYERSRFDSDAMFEELTKLADTEIVDVHLKALTLGVLAEHGDSLKRLPATQGKFFHPGAQLTPPVYLEPDVLNYLAARAKARGTSLSTLVNELLKKDIELIETVK